MRSYWFSGIFNVRCIYTTKGLAQKKKKKTEHPAVAMLKMYVNVEH